MCRKNNRAPLFIKIVRGCKYDSMDGGGRAEHDYRDIGGRVTPGRLQGSKRLKSYGTGFPAVTEEARAENRSVYGIHEDSSRSLTLLTLPIDRKWHIASWYIYSEWHVKSREKTINRGA